MAAKKKKNRSSKLADELRVTGVFVPELVLDKVKPNNWNPNKVPLHKMEAIREGMKREGWILSEPLLIWESDEKGRKKMVIINGEHRWTIAKGLGFKTGPAVVLRGLSKAKAVEHTIMLDNNRGEFEEAPLALAIKSILPSIKTEDPAKRLGFTQIQYTKLMELPKLAQPGKAEGGKSGGIGRGRSQNDVAKQVNLYMDDDQHREFMDKVTRLGDELGLDNVTKVVLRSVDECYTNNCSG